MPVRRRRACLKPKECIQKPESRPDATGYPEPEGILPGNGAKKQFFAGKPAPEGYLPVAVVLEIMAREYDDSAQGEALCRAALQVAEEGGVIEHYRARWNSEEPGRTGRLSLLLYDRRQCLELIRYHEIKGNLEALRKEKEKLKVIEGRLLLGGVPPAKITEEDLEELERYIKECGF
ncbi:MAG: hypothetical protein HPY89_06975 [Pelotomaculum sp.]|uniref:Uncharacterized protein n=1 Tax=Pelotomaculum thermopropionicum (strain DSM 13744 / JCM 10971 / SI) TaxID=370438 RepID=A5D533_PELTS|nr:hypothetical protein [Pelotomaculum sp.]BAF58636.1 hypothetical protein PTH_0455 [Pelotomaculum thermopropionicum SI]